MESMIYAYTMDNLAFILGGSVAVGVGLTFIVWVIGFAASLIIEFFKN